MEKNVRQFFSLYQHSICKIKLSEEELETLIQQSVSLISEEKMSPDRIFFYHAVDNVVGFLYDVYTELYRVLEINNQIHTLRYDNPYLKKFDNIYEFLIYYSDNGKKEINNNDEFYCDYAISTNIFLFGNHETPGSNSITYMLENFVARTIDLNKMLERIFSSFQINHLEIKKLINIYDLITKKTGGRLYQISLSQEDASQYAYAAGCVGIKNPLNKSQIATLDIVKILLWFRQHNNFQSADKKYIANLQARLMIPHYLALQVKSVVWHPLNQKQQINYEILLTKVVNTLAQQILAQLTTGSYHANSVLGKVLPTVLKKNDVNDQQIRNNLFVYRVKDYDSLYNILQLIVLDERLTFINQCLLEKRLCQNFINEAHQIVWILELLPPKDRFELAMKYNHVLVGQIPRVHEVANLLTNIEKRKLILLHITDFFSLYLLIQVFDKDERFSFMKKCADENKQLENIINYCSRDYYILFVELFPPHDRLDFMCLYHGGLDSSEFETVADKLLDADQKKQFLSICYQKIFNKRALKG